MSGKKENDQPMEVKDRKSQWAMFFLNILMTCLVVVGGFALEQLTAINTKVGSIDTTTQLTSQRLEIHEVADNKKFSDIISQIRKLQDKQP